MTREEAIRELKEDIELYIPLRGTIDDVDRDLPDGRLITALEMAIKALEQEPCEDAVSRQAVLDIIRNEDNWLLYAKGHTTDTEIAFSGLKSKVSALPPVTPQPNKEDIHREREQAYMRGYEDGGRKYRTEQSEDAISRQAAIDIVDSYSESQSNVEDVTQDIISDIVALPPVNPQEPKTGHWINHYDEDAKEGWYECDRCHTERAFNTDFCPDCGARMVEPQETKTWNGYHGQITAPKGTFERIFNDADDDNDI